MGIPFKIANLIFAVMLFSATVSGFFYNPETGAVSISASETAETGTFFSENLPFLNSFAINDGSGAGYSVRVVTGSSNQLQAFKAVMHALEVQVECALSNCISQVSIFPVRIRKSDLLFPFHYFFESIMI
jgi:hypothetical protein